MRNKSIKEPDWSDRKTHQTELWKNRLIPLSERLEIADGAVAYRDEIIFNLRTKLGEAERDAEQWRARLYLYVMEKHKSYEDTWRNGILELEFRYLSDEIEPTLEEWVAAIDAAMLSKEENK